MVSKIIITITNLGVNYLFYVSGISLVFGYFSFFAPKSPKGDFSLLFKPPLGDLGIQPS
ncbi:MAG: hypothetical protein ACI94Y_002858 [Maribacter sp.]|jgi:hypothetical protein